MAAIDVFAKKEWVEFGAPIEDVTFPNGDKGCPVVEEEGLGRLTTLELKLGSYPHTNRDLRPSNAPPIPPSKITRKIITRRLIQYHFLRLHGLGAM